MIVIIVYLAVIYERRGKVKKKDRLRMESTQTILFTVGLIILTVFGVRAVVPVPGR